MTLTIIAGIIGILGTWFAWRYNVKRRLNAELDKVKRQLEEAEDARDLALEKMDGVGMTQATAIIINLLEKKRDIEVRLKGEK